MLADLTLPEGLRGSPPDVEGVSSASVYVLLLPQGTGARLHLQQIGLMT